MRGSTLIAKYNLTAFFNLVTNIKWFRLCPELPALQPRSGLSENPKNNATCLYTIYFNRLKKVCQPFSAENHLFPVIFFEKFFRGFIGRPETVNIIRAAQKNFPNRIRSAADQGTAAQDAIIFVIQFSLFQKYFSVIFSDEEVEKTFERSRREFRGNILRNSPPTGFEVVKPEIEHAGN